jgi:dTDP-4-dehydrorhamnose 3,5-epimerase
MNIQKTKIYGSYLIKPEKHSDNRGFFIETWNMRTLSQKVKIDPIFLQDNFSRSKKNVLRGLHYQIKKAQGKLVRVAYGSIFDVVVDLRLSSPSFQNWYGVKLCAKENQVLWIPPGCAHGFYVLTKYADVLYKTTEYRYPEHERCIIWNDKSIGVDWHLSSNPIISEKDQIGQKFQEAELFK